MANTIYPDSTQLVGHRWQPVAWSPVAQDVVPPVAHCWSIDAFTDILCADSKLLMAAILLLKLLLDSDTIFPPYALF